METHSSGDAEEITWRAADLNLSGRTRLIVPARASTKQIIKLLDESFPLTPEWIQRSKADSTDNDPRVKGFPKDLLAHKNPMEYWTKNERLTVGGEHYLAKQKPSGCSELRLTVHQGFVETKDWRSEELFKELEAAPNLFYVRYGMADNKPEVVAIIRQQRFDSWCEAEAYIAVGNVIKDLRELEAATIENQDVVRKVAEFIDGTAP